MIKLLPVVIISLILTALAESCSVTTKDKLNRQKYIKKDKFFCILLAIVLAMFVGLRTSYNDTGAYLRGYAGMNASLGMALFNNIEWKWGKYPGFSVTNIVLKLLGVSTQGYLVILALLTIGIYVWFIRKYTENLWLSVFLFITMGCYVFTMAGQKQVIAVALCTVGVDRAMRKKWIPFVFWILLGSTFHPYTLTFLVVPLLEFLPWTKRTYLILALFAGALIGFQPFLESVEDISNAMGKGYSVAELSGNSVNIFRVMVTWVPVVLSYFVRDRIKEDNNNIDNTVHNLTMLNAELMGIGLLGTAIYWGRLANYFLIYSTISLPSIIKNYPKQTRQLLTLCAVLGYLVYFYYDNCIARPFDADYEGISIFEYISSLY